MNSDCGEDEEYLLMSPYTYAGLFENVIFLQHNVSAYTAELTTEDIEFPIPPAVSA